MYLDRTRKGTSTELVGVDRVREFHIEGRLGGTWFRPVQQIFGGLSRGTVLRWKRKHRPSRIVMPEKVREKERRRKRDLEPQNGREGERESS